VPPCRRAAVPPCLWQCISACYTALTTHELPDKMPVGERRSLDAVMHGDDGRFRVAEVDEVQHFSPPRALTFSHYPDATRVAYDRSIWQKRSSLATKLRGSGWGRPKPPLFPFEGGRHAQRALRDMLADVLPPTHGWAPTLRIGDWRSSWVARRRGRDRAHGITHSGEDDALTYACPARGAVTHVRSRGQRPRKCGGRRT
jgi:hypothetical protein